MLKNSDKLKALQALFPSTTLNIEGVDVVIEPMQVQYSKEFADICEKVMPALISGATAGASDEAFAMRLIPVLIPIAFGEFIALCNLHVDVDLKTVPHHLVPRILDKWLEVSFGDAGKVKPWMDLFKAVQKRFLSSAATTSPTSSEGSTPS